MTNLLTRFEAAHAGLPLSSDCQTPLARLPRKEPKPVECKTASNATHSPIRTMKRLLLMDVTNSQELGMIVRAEPLADTVTRIETTLTIVDVRDKSIVRGNLNGRALKGAQVAQVDLFVER